MKITDERLAEMVGAGVPCVPAQPGEIAAVAQELRALRAASIPAPETQEPVAWVTEDILAAMKRGERAVPGWKPSADFCIPLYAGPIPAPERSKEETSFGVDAAEDEVRKLLHPKKEPDENGFIIGEPVEKFTGEARWEGVLVASYLTTKGQRRYVVEVKPQGFQMIAVPAQLRMIATLETPPLHKEGEDHGRYLSRDDYCATDEGHPLDPDYAAPAPVPVTITDAARDVLAERKRQVEAEGWTPEHDDAHTKGEIGKAAGVYALAASDDDYRWVIQGLPVHDYLAATFKLWPWDWSWFKPKDRRRDLVKAGALILAEIERLDRAALSAKPGEE